MDKAVVVINHFYNEQFLMPYWLDHYLRIADHIVMLDYDSNDNSSEIINTLGQGKCEVRNMGSRFDSREVELAIQQVEKEFPDAWKATVNTTEFLVCPFLRELLRKTPHRAIEFSNYIMVDMKEDSPLDSSKPLLLQRPYGYKDVGRDRGGNRYLHSGRPDEIGDGKSVYGLGRDTCTLPIAKPVGYFLAWWGFSPWPQSIPRKLQMQQRLSDTDKNKGYGRQHTGPDYSPLTIEELWKRYYWHRDKALDLMEDPMKAEAIKRFYD